MKSIAKRIIYVLFSVFVITAFSSCEFLNSIFYEKSTEKGSIYGTWESSASEKWVITENTLDYYCGETLSFAGDSLKVVKTSDTAGYIFLRYTSVAESEYTNPKSGNWYALHFKELTTTSCKISLAYKTEGNFDISTLEDAAAEFSIENGYFSSYSEAEKK